jgi:uncharacterized protein (DUF1330 family)
MAAYVIAELTVFDPEGYEPYKRLAEQSIAAFGGTYLVRGGIVDSIEGDPVSGRVVVVEFPDLETARSWYASEEYSAALPVRQATATTRLFIVQGYDSTG